MLRKKIMSINFIFKDIISKMKFTLLINYDRLIKVKLFALVTKNIKVKQKKLNPVIVFLIFPNHLCSLLRK